MMSELHMVEKNPESKVCKECVPFGDRLPI